MHRTLFVLAPQSFLEDDDHATARLIEAAREGAELVRVALALVTVGSSRCVGCCRGGGD